MLDRPVLSDHAWMLPRALALTTVLALVAPPLARAQEQASASILQTQRSAGVEEGVASAFDRMLRQELDALAVVRVSGAVVLDLEQVQIALGCMGETVPCLQAVTAELDVQILLVPSIDRAGSQIVASVLLFDARDGQQRRAIRQAATEADLLQEVDPLLRELFGLPPRADGAGGGQHRGGGGDPVAPARPGLSPIPFVLIGAGVLAIGGGIGLGVVSQDDASAFRAVAPTGTTTRAQVDAAYDQLARAEAEAIAANVLFVAGGALVAGGIVWLLAAGNEDGSSPLAVAPVLAPGAAGVVLAGTIGGTP